MALIDTSGNLTEELQNVARILIQKKQFKVADQRDRDQTVLQTWASNAGQAIENVPGAVDAYRRVFGKAPTPGQIGTPQTLAQFTASRIAASPELADTATVVAATGQPGARSSAALTTERGTSEVNAATGKTVANTTKSVVDEASKTIAAASPETRSTIGQSMLLPGSVTISELNARDATGRLRQNMLSAAQAALDDPTGVGKGLDSTIRTVTGGRAGLTDAAAAVAMGTDDYLKIMGQLVVNNAAGRGVAENIQKGVAEDISKKSGGYWNPDEIVAYWNYQNSSQPSQAMESNAKYTEFVRAQQIGGQAYMNTMAAENSPAGQLLQSFGRFAQNRTMDDGQLNFFKSVIQNQMADQMVIARMGPRERYEPANGGSNESLAAWDAAKQAAMRLVPIPNPDVSFRDWVSGNTAPLLQGQGGGYQLPNAGSPVNAPLNTFLDSLRSFQGGSMTGATPMRGPTQ